MKHFATIQKEFIVKLAKIDIWTAYQSFDDFIKGRKFISPKTRNQVEFHSLPLSMQKFIRKKFDEDRQKAILNHMKTMRLTKEKLKTQYPLAFA